MSKGGVPVGMTGVFSVNQEVHHGKTGLSKTPVGIRDLDQGVQIRESGIRGTLPRVDETLESIPEEPRRTRKIILRRPSKKPSSEGEKTPPSKIVLRRPSKTPSEEQAKDELVKKKILIKLKSPAKKTPPSEVESVKEAEDGPVKKKTIIKLKSSAKKIPSSEVGSSLEPLRPSLLPRPREPSPPAQASPVANTSTESTHSYGLRSRRPRISQS
ncbi:hypothetical protein QBC41DRAFT_297882 [Cercophora samala]|uniref:Uncharacterized protein n=1 Tax=Cercophora samala TaxID=330535 RepID=A0AA39ZNN0_9PEZI|nr:hypothetical protein QBC41DRAFT_297882 [Cercophora samala]